MAGTRIGDLPEFFDAVDPLDLVPVTDVSENTTRKATVSELLAGVQESSVTLAGVQTLTNKTIDATQNTLINLPAVAQFSSYQTGLVGAVGEANEVRSVGGRAVAGDGGAGLFYWVPSRPKANHNGGTIISPTVPWNATAATYNDRAGETDVGGTGCWVLAQMSTVRPYHFGVVENTSCGPAFQDFLDFLGSTGDPYDFDISCDILTAQTFVLTRTSTRPNPLFAERRVIGGFCFLRAIADLSQQELDTFQGSAMLTMVRCGQWDFVGGFYIDGYLGVAAFHRLNHGIRLSNCNGICINRVQGQGMRGFLLYASSGPEENSNGVTIGDINANHCGYYSGQQVRPFSFLSFTGGETSFGRQTNISINLSEFSDSNILYSFLMIDGEIHSIQNYNRETQQAGIYPGFRDTYVPPAEPEASLIFGGAALVHGSDNGQYYFERIKPTNCGQGLHDAALYGAVAELITCEFVGVGYAVGRAATSTYGWGAHVQQLYAEFMDFDIVVISSSAMASIGDPIAVSPERVRCMFPPALTSRRMERVRIEGFSAASPDTPPWLKDRAIIIKPGGAFFVRHSVPRIVDGSNATRVDRRCRLGLSPVSTLQNFVDRDVTFYGMSAYFEVNAEEVGYTVNGQPSIVFPNGVPDGTKLYAYIDFRGESTDWKCSFQVPREVPGNTGTSLPVFPAASLPASPSLGTIAFDSTANKLAVWTGAAWETVTST